MKNDNKKWIVIVFILAFVLSIVFSGASTVLSNNLNTPLLIIVTLLVVAIGILFDMIGVAVLSCEEAFLHARASKKIKGAKEAIKLVKSAPKVSSVCCDVVGDICGIVSGTLGAVVTLNIANYFDFSATLTTILVTAVISALTVGFKAIFKAVATKNADKIILAAGKVVRFFTFNKEK
ncbi:MAG: hypothetical protein II625_07705 [Bacilli bacterium]|nr:hypothetical protein [Bacilli bacterium]